MSLRTALNEAVVVERATGVRAAMGTLHGLIASESCQESLLSYGA